MSANAITNQIEAARLSIPTGAEPVSETELEETIGVALIADYNEQLAGIAGVMQNTLDEKKTIRAELASLQMIGTKDSTEIDGTQAYALTQEEAELFQNQYPDVNLIEDGDGFALAKDGLDSLIASRQQELANVNTNSEMISLQIQSVINQRKEAILMLTNLIASRNDTVMSIARNLKV